MYGSISILSRYGPLCRYPKSEELILESVAVDVFVVPFFKKLNLKMKIFQTMIATNHITEYEKIRKKGEGDGN